MGDASLRPDCFGVMVHVSAAMVGNREVPQMDLFEVNQGALERPDVIQMVEDNKNAGFIIVIHRILTEATYENLVLMSGEHYTEDDVRLYEEQAQQ